MSIQTPRTKAIALGLGLALLFASGWVNADPPSRVARLGYASGTVSFSPAGDPGWLQAVVNRPVTTGDRLWVAADARAELQIGGAAVRLGPGTSVTLLNLNDRIAQVQLSQGSLKMRVRRLGPNQSFEVNTPNLAFTIRTPGEYRIDVDLDDNATAVTVQTGRGEVYGDGASYVVTQRMSYRFYGTGLSDYESMQAQRDDALDRWARERDRRVDTSKSARYLSSNVVGYEDLDGNGIWRSDPNFGNVWIPNNVAADWTPYRNGHWTWVDPWGWTWVDDQPWGYAVSHYGRWARLGGSAWGWVPGPPRERAVYAPALVAFVGGNNFQVSVTVGGAAPAAVGWFPLAPREVYQPSYPVSRGYFNDINRSNAVIPPATITNVYNTTTVINNTTVVNNTTHINKRVYANQTVTGAVVAVPALAFVQSQSVAKVAFAVSKEAAVAAPVANVAAVAPVQRSVHGGAASASAKPTGQDRIVVARTKPPEPPLPFATQQLQLAVKPGTPIDDVRRAQLKTGTSAVPLARVNVVTSVQVPTAQATPPVTAPSGKARDERRANAAKANGVKEDAGKVDATSADAAKAEAAKVGAAKAAAEKADASKAESSRAEAVKAETAKAASTKLEAAKADAAKAEVAKAEAAKAEAAKVGAAKAAAEKADASKAESSRAEAVKAETAKAASTKLEAAKADAAKAEVAKVEAAKAEAAKVGAAKAAAEKADASKAESSRAEAAKADTAKAASTKLEAAKVDAVKAEVAKAEAAKAEADRVRTSRVAAAQAEKDKAALEKRASNTPPSREKPGRTQKPEPDEKAQEDERKKKADAEVRK